MYNKQNLINNFINLPRFTKQTITILCDLFLCLVCVVVAFYLRLDILVSIRGPVITACLVSMIIAISIFWITGLYHNVLRYSGVSIIFSVFVSVMIYGLIYFSIFTIYRIDNVPRSIGIIQPMLLFFGILSSRLLIKFVFDHGYQKKRKLLKKTVIYGAGSSGRQLAHLLENSFEFKIIGFLDDDYKLHNQFIQGYKIYDPNQLEKIITLKELDVVLLALPSINRFKRNLILKKLRSYNIAVQTLPSISDIIEGKINVSDIKELDVNDILEREIIPPKKELLTKNIDNKVVLVTGAGGSIGSEICRQILKCKPRVLILCELSEFHLYKIYEELKIMNTNSKIVPLIVNIQNEHKISLILKTFRVNTVYHAAAYKHVPLVEANICESVLNNVFGTFSVVQASINNNISNFVLISSDKAVRSANIMGATKRLSELCVQASFHDLTKKNISVSIVRFGNVLESSGSVIPKFKQQIRNGGPITLTHPDVSRYFMTITEAAQLVIQAGAMSENCDVFVLDMGQSIKIKDLIYRIVNLSGLSVKDEKNPDGDIEIKVIGLRDGEKLYEELLLGKDPQPTIHEKIQKAQDPFIPLNKLIKNLNELKLMLKDNNATEVKLMLENIVSSYKSEYEVVDSIYLETKN